MRLRLLAVGLVFVTFISYAQNPCAPPPSGSGPALAGMIADRPFALTIKVTVDQQLVGGNVIRGERIIREARDRSGRTLFKQQVGCFTADDGQTQPFFSVQVRDPGAHSLTTWSSDNPWNPKIVTVAYNFPHIDLQPPPRVSDLRHPRILASSPNHVMVDLGTRTIAGVETVGTRTTNTIPAGVRGNVQPLVSTTEVWRAEALDITLIEIQDDPIEGTKRSEVTEITQGDPDPAVFAPPANYTTEEKDYNAASAATFRTPVVPSCFGAWVINVGVMEQNPFTADFVHAEWQIAPDGTKTRRVIMPGHIARDSEGRVAIQTPVRSHRAPSQADDAPDEVDEFATTVCDPHAQTLTTITSAHAEVKPTRYMAGPADVFRYLLQPAKELTMKDLGQKMLDGTPVRGYRWWKTAEGRAIGNTDVSEQLVLGFSTLRASVRYSGRRADNRFPRMTNLDKLNLVRWVGWGDDDEFCPELWGGRSPDQARTEDVKPYWVVPPGDSPFFDDWEAILLEREMSETLVWRHQRGGFSSSREVELPLGLFSEVCTGACDWFDRLQQERMGSTLREPKEGERPRFLKRIY